MPYFSDQNTFLHQSSLLIQAYPTTRITTKYSLPRKPNPHSRTPAKSKTTASKPDAISATDTESPPASTQKEKRERSATLTLKAYHPESGICLKYRTDKAQEVGRLLNGLGRLAKKEVIEKPTLTPAGGQNEVDGDKMDVDGGAGVTTSVKAEEKVVTGTPAAVQTGGQQEQQSGGGGGGKGKKKKGKK
jgi:hypothetical protein